MTMDSRELDILAAIEADLTDSDAAFALRMTGKPRLSLFYRLSLCLAAASGVFLMMLFPVNLFFAVAGYLVLVGAGTSVLRRRRFTPADEPPLETFHRLTGGLFRSSEGRAEIVD